MKINRPVSDQFRVSSSYGVRIDPVTKKESEFHHGIDFACPEGTEVRAICDGLIQRVGWENEGDHAQGFGLRIWQTVEESGVKYGIVYGHLSRIDVKDTMPIKKGEVIGLSGNSGKSTGPHLHIGKREWDSANYVEINV